MPNSLDETFLRGLMVAVFNVAKSWTCFDYHHSLQACLIQRDGHYLLFQTGLEDGNETISLPENTTSSFDGDVTDQASFEFSDECGVPLSFLVSKQEGLDVGNETISLQENNASSFDDDVSDQACVEFSKECEAPLVAFSASKLEGNVPVEKRDDECSADCESFHPADLLSFAWQIARGMASETFLIKKTTMITMHYAFCPVKPPVLRARKNKNINKRKRK